VFVVWCFLFVVLINACLFSLSILLIRNKLSLFDKQIYILKTK
jgi:hypothetical protein